MTECLDDDRPALDTVLFSLLLCLLSPGRLYPTRDEFVEHLLVLGVAKGLIANIQFGLDGTVPGARLLIREWLDRELLRRAPCDDTLRFTRKGLQLARANVLSGGNLGHRTRLECITRTLLRESIESVLEEPFSGPLFGATTFEQGRVA